MKVFRFISLILSLIILCNYSAAQSLTDNVLSIAEDYDLMGGSVIVFCNDHQVETIHFGESDHDRNILVSDSTVYRIASISKTVSAIALMQLAEQGLVNLDDEIGSILDFDVQNPYYTDRAITVRQILSHTSGIIDGDTYSDFLSATYSDDPIPDIRELINSNGSYYSTGLFNNNEPGSYFNYSNLNFGILGTIIEKVSGQRFDDYCKEHIFDALDLDASFNVNHIDNINNVAVFVQKIRQQLVASSR
jgi:CubicO group peptidase (beta-lactamase class C family)